MASMEFWGGVECTVNRVADAYRDQLVETGHHHRLGDLDLIAALGVTRVRYPILWERIAPSAPTERDWSWSDERLGRLRALNVEVIGGLVHHGSGPAYTSILDDSFAPGLAEHAAAVAARYPWIKLWTPVNEPLTTARFTGLYGHWHPHAHDETSFWCALLNQVDATRQAMAAIRRIIPDAQLLATDDLGLTQSTDALTDQARYDNHRRWMGWDLLTGRVGEGHPFWHRLRDLGFAEQLDRFVARPCPPDIIGINHYLTSDRFLDHRIADYPPEVIGGNGRTNYADTEAVRVLFPPDAGWANALDEAWERYGIPIALTEVHNGCTREEQLRWFRDAWQAALDARERGVDVRAVTAWALFGSKDWNTLLTRPGVYEPGLFDASGALPRPTALTTLAREMAGGGSGTSPVLSQQGWWLQGSRLIYPPVPQPATIAEHRAAQPEPVEGRPILIVGRTGTLGRALERECTLRNLPFVTTDRRQLDLTDPRLIDRMLEQLEPWIVINAAGWVRVDDAEGERDACWDANATGAIGLARQAAANGIPTVQFSSDLVFDGNSSKAYDEDATPRPLGVYGASKAAMEEAVMALPGRHLIVRTAAFFSPHDPYNFAAAVATTLRQGRPFVAAAVHTVSPTFTPDLARTVLDLAIDGEQGIWHLTSGASMSWAGFARRVADACQLDRALIAPVHCALPDWRARRPLQAALHSTRGQPMPQFELGLARFAALVGH